jgi:hypothetical protein
MASRRRRRRKASPGAPGPLGFDPGDLGALGTFGDEDLTPFGDDLRPEPSATDIPGIDIEGGQLSGTSGEVSVADLQRLLLDPSISKRQAKRLRSLLKQAIRRERALAREGLAENRVAAKLDAKLAKADTRRATIEKQSGKIDRLKEELEFGGGGFGGLDLEALSFDESLLDLEDADGGSNRTLYIVGGLAAAALLYFTMRG